ncbi:MAG: hypothetical protein AB7K04_16385 [Pseudorhodoplanes sp.]
MNLTTSEKSRGIDDAEVFLTENVPAYARDILLQHWQPKRLQEAVAVMRPAGELMTADMLRLQKVCDVSISRTLIEKIFEEKWRFERRFCEVDANGKGLVVYDIIAKTGAMTFATRCNGLAPIERSGRIRDNEMDFYSVLFDGRVEMDRIWRETEEAMTKVWRGRTDNDSLGWSFANRSNRHFEYMVNALANGEQPDMARMAETGGYFIRNAGYYGNGRHGCRTWTAFGVDHPLGYPYHVDLFMLYMWKLVGYDFVETIARQRSSKAVGLSKEIKRYLGIGNASGIGMVAAVIRWPHWVSAFCYAREFCLAMALTQKAPIEPSRVECLMTMLERASHYYRESFQDIDPEQENRVAISGELLAIRDMVPDVLAGAAAYPLMELIERVRRGFSRNVAEQLASLIVDMYPETARRVSFVLPSAMLTRRDVHPEMRLDALLHLIEQNYRWATDIDFSAPDKRHYFWYRSEENGENRRGERAVDPGVKFETFVDVAWHIQGLRASLLKFPADWTVARYLVENPDDVYIISRVQISGEFPYSEVQANVTRQTFHPSDMIRFYLTVLGMESTDPTNMRWVTGTFLQGAPMPDDILSNTHRDWSLPSVPRNDKEQTAR